MGPHDPHIQKAAELARRFSHDAGRLVRRAKKRRLVERIVRAALWMALTLFIVIPGMIAAGFLLGPRGHEGVIAAPLVLFSLWALILYVYFGRRPSARHMKKVELARLPAVTGEWLEDARAGLPHAAQQKVDVLVQQLDALALQLEGLSAETPHAHEIRSLLSAELPELVRGYRKVPAAMRSQPLYDGHTPEQQLLEGLATIERSVAQLHERLARDDLHALATHQRYLDLKYNRKDKVD